MSELKLPRLLAAAKEFNVGQDTLVEYLVSKGFSRDDLKPTAKLTEDMYRSLQQQFQSDKVAKTKADQIEIPKGAPAERRKRDEEEISFRKEEKPRGKKFAGNHTCYTTRQTSGSQNYCATGETNIGNK